MGQRRARKIVPIESRFSLEDYKRLERQLTGKPETVLRAFQDLNITCLTELEMYVRMKAERPEIAARILLFAVSMGIPEYPDDDKDAPPRP